MARQRFIHPCIWNSEDFCRLGDTARLLFIGLFSTADDEGRRKASLASLKGEIFPQDERSLAEIESALQEVAQIGMCRVYEVAGQRYLDLPSWSEYQHPKYPTKSRLPACPKDSRNAPPILPERSPSGGEVVEERSSTGRDGLGRVGMGWDGSGRGGVGVGGRGASTEPRSEQPPPPSHPSAPAGEDAGSHSPHPPPGAPHIPLEGAAGKGEERDRTDPRLVDLLDSARTRPEQDHGRRWRKNAGLTKIDDTPHPSTADEEARIAQLRRQQTAILERPPGESPTDLDDEFPPPPPPELT